MSLSEILEKSERWLDLSGEIVSKQTFRSNTRRRISGALLHLAMEHHGSIYLLVDNGHFGSAFSLLRPQFESYIRGVWFLFCASDTQIKTFIKKDELPRVRELLEGIRKVPGYEEGVLESVKRSIWSQLCGYTHGGYVQVAYRNTNNEIASDFEEGHIVNFLYTSCTITFISCVAFAKLVESDEMASELLEAHKSIFQ